MRAGELGLTVEGWLFDFGDFEKLELEAGYIYVGLGAQVI